MHASPVPDNRLLATPVASNQGRPWSGIGINVYEWTSARSIGSGVLDQDVIGMRISGTVRLRQVRDGKTHSAMSRRPRRRCGARCRALSWSTVFRRATRSWNASWRCSWPRSSARRIRPRLM